MLQSPSSPRVPVASRASIASSVAGALAIAGLVVSSPARADPGASPPPAASDNAADKNANEAVDTATHSSPVADKSGDRVVQEAAPAPTGGMGGNVVRADDPEAKRARSELEGTSLAGADTGVPERLPPLQRAAWWTLFGGFALASAGGVFAGLAEVQEDRAERIATTIDLESGGQYMYADKQAEYEDLLAKGERQQWVARGLLIGAGVTLGAAIAIFAVDGARARKQAPRRARRMNFGAGGLEVAF